MSKLTTFRVLDWVIGLGVSASLYSALAHRKGTAEAARCTTPEGIGRGIGTTHDTGGRLLSLRYGR